MNNEQLKAAVAIAEVSAIFDERVQKREILNYLCEAQYDVNGAFSHVNVKIQPTRGVAFIEHSLTITKSGVEINEN